MDQEIFTRCYQCGKMRNIEKVMEHTEGWKDRGYVRVCSQSSAGSQMWEESNEENKCLAPQFTFEG
jgi:hypothetical protein